MWVRCWSLLNKSGVGPRPQRPWFHGGCGFLQWRAVNVSARE